MSQSGASWAPRPRARDRAAEGQLPIPPAPGRALPDLDLSRIHSEDQHDGEASQEAQVLDDKGDQDAAVPFILLADLVHLRELRRGEKQESCSSFLNLGSPGQFRERDGAH